MGFLRTLRPVRVHARAIRNVLRTVHFLDLGAARANRLTGQHHGVGTHVGDVAVFVEPLRGRHRVAGAHAQFSTRFLLEGARREGGGGPPRVGLGLEVSDGGFCAVERLDEQSCALLGENRDVCPEALFELTRVGEVTPRGDPLAVEGA